MNLVIDVGNTLVKLAVFNENKLLKRYDVSKGEVLKTLRYIRKNYPAIQACMVSSVGNWQKASQDYIQKYYHTIILNHETPIPFKNKYATPKTLGIDRIALVSAAVQQYPNNNTLIIDSGTCITYDFITNKNEYVGGAISPGINMRYQALHNQTANLPLLKKNNFKLLTGNSTATSIHSGVVQGVTCEIEGIIQKYNKKYPDLTVILTGGDAKFLSKQLKSSIFANSNFLLEGLNYILQNNTHS